MCHAYVRERYIENSKSNFASLLSGIDLRKRAKLNEVSLGDSVVPSSAQRTRRKLEWPEVEEEEEEEAATQHQSPARE